MISSKCEGELKIGDDVTSYHELRREIKGLIESCTLFDKRFFDVILSEELYSQGGENDSWEVCRKIVRECDILIVLFTGHAGTKYPDMDIGICHAELMTGLNIAPKKVRLIDLGNIAVSVSDDQKALNERFIDYKNNYPVFRGGNILSKADVLVRVEESIVDASYELIKGGLRESSRGANSIGEPLQWSRKNYSDRSQSMVSVIQESLKNKNGEMDENGYIHVSFRGQRLLFIPNAIPDSLSISQAKEMVGQPFLHDHELAELLQKDEGGPIHIIACHKGATETQAKKLLGFPDATVVKGTFGIYVADNIQKVQFVFITECRDESNTYHGVQRLFDWLKETGEDHLLIERAISRAKIIRTIAREYKNY